MTLPAYGVNITNLTVKAKGVSSSMVGLVWLVVD